MAQIFEKSLLYMMFNLYLYEMHEMKLQISSLINLIISLRIKKVYESFKNTYSKYHVLAIFILNLVFFNYSSITRYLCKYLLRFGSNGDQTNPFFEIPRIYLFIFSQLFSKKELKNTKKLKKITIQKINNIKIVTISSIIIGLLFIINIACLEKLYKRKQHFSLLKKVDKNLINPKNYPIVPLFILWLDDNEIILDAGVGCESESIDQGRSYVDKNINISDCFFKRYLSYSGDGGVICVTSSSYSMNINYSMFYNCVCSSWRGAIYFDSSNSSLRMICANKCSCGASSYDHFAFLSAFQVNQVEYLSVSNCSHATSGYCSFCLSSGDQRVYNTNSSMNNAIWVSGILIISPSSFTSSHSTFSNNKVTDGICIQFCSTPGTISILYANIVHNNSPSNGVVYVNGEGSKKMMYCIFNNNQNYLFCVWAGSLEVFHSFIYHSASSFSTLTVVSTSNNNSFTNTITYQLQFFNSLHCNADMPLPHRTMMETMTLNLTPMNTAKETPYRSYDDSIENKSNSLFLYSTVCIFMIIVVMISYNIGSQRNHKKNDSSSLSSSLETEKKHKREENRKKENGNGNENNSENENDSKRDHQKNHHHDYLSSPFVF